MYWFDAGSVSARFLCAEHAYLENAPAETDIWYWMLVSRRPGFPGTDWRDEVREMTFGCSQWRTHVETRRLHNVVPILADRLRRSANIETAFEDYLTLRGWKSISHLKKIDSTVSSCIVGISWLGFQLLRIHYITFIYLRIRGHVAIIHLQ